MKSKRAARAKRPENAKRAGTQQRTVFIERAVARKSDPTTRSAAVRM